MSFPGLSSKLVGLLVCAAMCGTAMGQEAPSMDGPGMQAPAPVERQEAEPVEERPTTTAAMYPALPDDYDKTIFEKPLAAGDLSFLKQFDRMPARELWRDKQFHKLLGSILPTGEFHYGRDRSLNETMDIVTHDSNVPVRVLDGRYVTIVGDRSLYLSGLGFLWIDMQDGIALGGFTFHPTNGEPTPSVVVFSRQIMKQDSIGMGQLPPEFGTFLRGWMQGHGLRMITARYFITGSNRRILLEHDEDYCGELDGMPPPDDATCENMDYQALDLDVTVADYLEATHHATNATAWMASGEQMEWVQMRQRRCGVTIACRIEVTRARRDVILHRPPSGPRRGPHR